MIAMPGLRAAYSSSTGVARARASTLRPRQERAQADQVVRRGREGDDPIHEFPAAMAQLAEAADGFHPAKHLFHQLAFPLTDGIAGGPCGPAVDRTAAVF